MRLEVIDDKKIWKDFIKKHNYPTSFFQSWNWGIFQEKIGKQVLRLSFKKNEEIIGIALGIIIKAKRGRYLYIRNGPITSWNDEQLNEEIIDLLKKKARELNLWFIRISPLISKESTGAEFLRKKDYPISKMYDVDALDTWLIDLEQEEEEIMNKMRKSTRYEIRKAKREGVEVISTKDISMIDEFYKIYKDTIKRQEWNGYTKEYIKTQFETFKKDEQAKLFLAKYQGTFIAGSIFIYFNESTYYHYSGMLTEYRKIPATSLIHWKNIKESKKRGIKTYNFWGITPEGVEDHPWEGLTFYKKGFGGYAKRWLETRDIPISPLYQLTRIIETYDKWKKGY
jgi:lipid II:glycine glycyltransferase (peptidoglycan interpeptide bridge formation enzyme)